MRIYYKSTNVSQTPPHYSAIRDRSSEPHNGRTSPLRASRSTDVLLPMRPFSCLQRKLSPSYKAWVSPLTPVPKIQVFPFKETAQNAFTDAGAGHQDSY